MAGLEGGGSSGYNGSKPENRNTPFLSGVCLPASHRIVMSNVLETTHVISPPSVAGDLSRAILLSPNAVAFATDAEGILTHTDGIGLAKIDAKPGDGIGQHVAEFFRFTSAERVNVMKVLKGEPLVATTQNKGRYFERRFVPSVGPDGVVTGLVGFSTDITDRSQLDEVQFVEKELLHNLFDSIPEITHVLDRDLRILMANRASRNIFQEDQLIGAHCYKAITGNDAPCPFCPVLKMYQSGQPENAAFYDEQRDLYQELNCYPVRDREGNLIGAVETAYNVTEKKKAQLALEQSEALLRDTFASISDELFVIDRNYTILRTNRVVEETYSAHMPLLGKKCYETSVCNHVCTSCPAGRMFKTQKPVSLERYTRHANNGPGVWLDHTAYPIRDEATSKVIGAISFIRNVTERKQVELELQKYRTELEDIVDRRTHELTLSETRMRSILETSSAPITIVDWKGNITYVNKSHQKLFGYSEDDIYGRSALFNSEGTEADHQWFWDILKGTNDYKRLTTRFHLKDGRTIWADVNASVVRSTDPTETQLICVIVDMTERQQILEELQRAKAAAEDANKAKSQFLATMSHEIRTPLNGVIGLSDLLLTTNLQPKQLEYAKLIKASGNSLLFLINDVLDFSKIEAGKFELDNTEFDLYSLVESVVGIMAAKANEQNLELAVTFGAKVPRPVRGDIGRLRQILINLVGNGLKFTQVGGVRIHVSTEEIRDENIVIRFDVIDNGIGIPEERLHRLFQPFSQVDASSARVYGGTGLGLAICKTLVELMGGTIGVQSSMGKGSTFWLSLPFECSSGILECLRSPETLCVEREATVCQRTGAEFCPGTHRRVELNLSLLFGLPTLIVSANEIQRIATETQFKTWGLATETTTGGTEAWELLDSASQCGLPFRLVVVDTELADSPGTALIDRILHDERMTELGIIGLIPLSAESENNFHREKGVLYLTKPVYCSSLFDAVMMALFKDQLANESSSSDAASMKKGASWGRYEQTPLRVLVAEDNRINQIVIGEILANAGIEYKIVGNGLEACNAVKDEMFDAVLMDCQMPQMDGYEATAEIRNWEHTHHRPIQRLPIIALTANATKGDVEKCLGAGMDAYCSKPIDPNRVIELIGFWTTKETPLAAEEGGEQYDKQN